MNIDLIAAGVGGRPIDDRTVEIVLPGTKYDPSWAHQSPRTPTEKCIHALSIAERRRLKAERKVLLAAEQERRKSHVPCSNE